MIPIRSGKLAGYSDAPDLRASGFNIAQLLAFFCNDGPSVVKCAHSYNRSAAFTT
jgi:hypothetical protein